MANGWRKRFILWNKALLSKGCGCRHCSDRGFVIDDVYSIAPPEAGGMEYTYALCERCGGAQADALPHCTGCDGTGHKGYGTCERCFGLGRNIDPYLAFRAMRLSNQQYQLFAAWS